MTRPADLFEDVVHSLDQSRAILYESVAAPIAPGGHAAGHRQHVPALFEGRPGGDERPALLRGLDDDDRARKPADDAIPSGKVPRQRPAAWRKLADDAAAPLGWPSASSRCSRG